MQSALKVKIKTLINEARDIRHEERKHMLGNAKTRQRIARTLALGSAYDKDAEGSRRPISGPERLRLEKKLARSRARLSNPQAIKSFNSLRHHRTHKVRGHARSCFLAYGFIRGHEYNVIETNAKLRPDWAEVRRLIEKFSDEGTQAWEQRFNDFKIASGFVPNA